MGLIKPDAGWRLPDELWHQMAPLLPARKAYSLGCHNPRLSDRSAMNAIAFVLRTGALWNVLNRAGIYSSSAAHWRFQEWVQTGLFEEFWRLGLLNLLALDGIDWSWVALDSAMIKAPLSGEQPATTLRGSRQRRRLAQRADRGERHRAGRRGGRGEPAGYEAGRGDADRSDGASHAADSGQVSGALFGQRL
jgi:transposase